MTFCHHRKFHPPAFCILLGRSPLGRVLLVSASVLRYRVGIRLHLYQPLAIILQLQNKIDVVVVRLASRSDIRYGIRLRAPVLYRRISFEVLHCAEFPRGPVDTRKGSDVLGTVLYRKEALHKARTSFPSSGRLSSGEQSLDAAHSTVYAASLNAFS